MDDVSTDRAGAWAVGAWGNQHPVALRWNGRTWIPTKVEDPGPREDGLSGVATVSPDWVWAVGRHQVGSDFRTLVERWDGTSWVIATSPNNGATQNNYLLGVNCGSASDCWSVGYYVVGITYQTLVERWDGKTGERIAEVLVEGKRFE